MTDALRAAEYDFRRPTFEVQIGEWVREVPSSLLGSLVDVVAPGFGDVFEFDETTGLFSSVTVDVRMDRADRCTLTVASRFDHERGAFVDVDWDVFAPGRRLEVSMGYGDRRRSVFAGSITEIGTDFPAAGAPTITVGGLGRYNELTKNATERSWDDGESDAAIVEELADEYGLEAAVDDPGPFGGLGGGAGGAGGTTTGDGGTETNDHDSDADFLDALAARNAAPNGRFEAFVRGETLYFRAPRDDETPRHTLTYGESLRSFSPEFSEANALERVEVRHWDSDRKEAIVGVAEREGGSGTRIVRTPVRTETQATAIAEATLTDQRADRREGDGETVGLPELDVGEPIELRGLGERFSGTYYVVSVTHRFDGSGYTTEFTARVPNAGVSA